MRWTENPEISVRLRGDPLSNFEELYPIESVDMTKFEKCLELTDGSPTAEAMVLGTIKCGFESLPSD